VVPQRLSWRCSRLGVVGLDREWGFEHKERCVCTCFVVGSRTSFAIGTRAAFYFYFFGSGGAPSLVSAPAEDLAVTGRLKARNAANSKSLVCGLGRWFSPLVAPPQRSRSLGLQARSGLRASDQRVAQQPPLRRQACQAKIVAPSDTLQSISTSCPQFGLVPDHKQP